MKEAASKIVVVGAGIVGSTQALLLSRAGYSVTLVDAGNGLATQEAGLNVRSVALSCRSYQMLAQQALWPENSGCLINAVHVTERGRFGAVRLRAEDLDVSSLGVVIPNHTLESHLMQQVKNDSNIRLMQPATARVIASTTHLVSLRIATETDSENIDAVLLVAADGTHSEIRQSLGIKTKTVDYQQHAVVANVQTQHDHQNVAYERFTDSGPLALLPLARNKMAMVMTTDSIDAESLLALSDEEFLALLQQRFGGKLGRFEAIGRRAMFPLSLFESRSPMKQRVVLVGNSARTLHPVAGQGLNLALRDVFELSACLIEGQTVDQSLRDFAESRAPDQRSVVRQTDLLARAFRHQPWPLSVPLGLFRTSAMMLLDTVSPLRSRFGAAGSGLNVPLRNFVPQNSDNEHF